MPSFALICFFHWLGWIFSEFYMDRYYFSFKLCAPKAIWLLDSSDSIAAFPKLQYFFSFSLRLQGGNSTSMLPGSYENSRSSAAHHARVLGRKLLPLLA
mmetsp:Transcript_11137/g.32999  ORF Transcript_11137/g.32999 Transcript_11137/m.32999 type:complete len:99 (-) Transcript_11137:3-299(-)